MRVPRTWLITDTHFGHQNIISYCKRPFQTAAEMDAALIESWNKYVMPEDIVFHLGDVAMGHSASTVSEIMGKLAGRKILILGNHDTYKGLHWWMTKGGFNFACEALLYRGVWLTHKPATELPTGATLNIHGHLHNLDATDPGFRNNPNNRGGHEGGDKPFNKLLAIEHTDYKPVLWDQFVPKESYGNTV